MKFSDVIGQQDVKERLLQMVEEDRLPHALMLCGPLGCGKMALALAFASHLLGDGPMLEHFEHPDLHFTFPVIRPKGAPASRKVTSDDFMAEWHELLDKGAYFTMEQWLHHMNADKQQAAIFEAESDNLTRTLSLRSSQGGYKIDIMYLPERMREQCANKILKLLEEPPSQTLFIFVSERPDLLLTTIRSRLQRIDVKPIDTESIEKALMEQRGIDADNAHRIARLANGNWIKALEELDANNENMEFLDAFIMLMRMAYMRNVQALKKWSENVSTMGREKQIRLLTYAAHLVRENFVYNFHNPELNYMTQAEENFSRNFARFINENNVIPITQLIDRSIREIGQNANPKMVFFDLAMQMIVLLIQK